MHKKILLASLFVLSILSGCQKENENEEPVISVLELNDSDELPVIISVPAPPDFPIKADTTYFKGNWDELETMPVLSGQPAIPAPWSAAAHCNFSDDIRDDYKKADGWEWLVSSFSYKVELLMLDYFVLYNPYKGVLRMYFYTGEGTQQVRDYKTINNTLKIALPYADNSPLMNFAGQEIIDVNINSSFGSKLEPSDIEDNTWYAIEQEITFDQNLSAQSYTNILFIWNIGFQKILDLKINGVDYENLPSAIKKEGIDFSVLENYRITENSDLTIRGESELQKASAALPANDAVALDKIFSQRNYSNLLNGVVPFDRQSPVTAHWKTSIDLYKDPNTVGIANLNLTIPGMDNSKVPGMSFQYNSPLGVFYLDRRPIVRYTKTDDHLGNQYRLDVKSVRYLFNPAVLQLATIENIKQEIIATDGTDLIKDYSQPKLYTGQTLSSNLPLTIQGVRVSFDVVPKNGDPAVTIIKTFKADVTIN